MQRLVDIVDQLQGQQVIVRANYDVPIESGKVVDTTRIEDSLSTIQLLLEYNCSVRLFAHQGRPKGQFDSAHSLEPVKDTLAELLDHPVGWVSYQPNLARLEFPEKFSVAMLENLRFWPGERANDPIFAKNLSVFGQVYVNQAFANCHRQHASMDQLPRLLPACMGVNLAQELDILTKARNHPDTPLVVIIGGAKLETKEPLVQVFANTASKILVGGKVALDLKKKHQKLPSNVVLAEMVESGKDITSASAKEFARHIYQAKTVIWNGTMGVFEENAYQKGTRIVAEAVHATSANTIVGGGDTETALTELNLEDNINFISTGGGAMLHFLSQGSLPAIAALDVSV